MLTFLIPVRHPSTVRDWSVVKELMSQTIASISAQTSSAWRCLIAAEAGCDLPRLPPNVEVVTTNISAPNLPDPSKSMFPYWQAVRVDKGARARAALRARPLDGYYMVTDYDDLVSSRLAAHCDEHPEVPGWYMPDGYAYAGRNMVLRMNGNFHERCGTCQILAARILENAYSDAPEGDFDAQNFLGSHVLGRRELQKTKDKLLPLPFRGAVYRVQVASSTSGNSIRSLIFDDRNPLAIVRRSLGLGTVTHRFRQEFLGETTSGGA